MALFTAATAAEMGRRSAAARAAQAQRIAAEPPQPVAPSTDPLPPPLPTEPVDAFAVRRLTRVRAQLDRLDALMCEESDPKRLKELADASSRVSAQEFALAGRPLPGSRRPAPTGKLQASAPPATSGPWIPAALPDPAPAPAPAPVPLPDPAAAPAALPPGGNSSSQP